MATNPPKSAAFLSTIRKSALVEPERLSKAVTEYQTSSSTNLDDSVPLAEFLVRQGIVSKWQAEKLLLGKHKGFFLGKYRLISLLGKGGMSSVFLAEHVVMRRRCAIKVLPTKRVSDSSYLARFHREAQAVAALDHPNIVRAYDVDHQVERDAEIHFLVMEYVEGASLQELVQRNGTVGFEDAVDYLRQAALGLEHAHQAGMVHRDIKPANLLVDPSGTVKLLDLGLARYFSAEEEGKSLTIAHDEKVLGTADYLSPEQALDSHTVDHRADLYSLGCTLYFLLTGQPPFTEGTLAQRLMAHQTKQPKSVLTKRPDTPASLVTIIEKLMAKKIEDRYATAQQVADAAALWLKEQASPAWKQAHPAQTSSSTANAGIGNSVTNRPAQAIPLAKPVALPAKQAKLADSQTAWPTGDITHTTSEPELSAFLSQIHTTPTKANSSTTLSPSSSTKVIPAQPSKTRPGSSKITRDPAVPPSFDFLQPEAKQPQLDPVAAVENSPAAQSSLPVETDAASFAIPKMWLILGGVACAAVLMCGFYLMTGGSQPHQNKHAALDPQSRKQEIWKKPIITVSPQNGDYTSLTAALADVPRFFHPKDPGPNSPTPTKTIQIDPGTYAENIVIDGSNAATPWPDGVIVRGLGDVIFQPLNGTPVLTIQDTPGLVLENLTLDATRKPIGMQVSGHMMGGRIAKLRIRNYADTGLLLHGVQGFGDPLRVEHIRCESKSENSIGIQVKAHQSGSAADDANNLLFSNCRLNGPMSAGIEFQGIAPNQIAVRETLFVKAAVGIRFRGAGRWTDFVLANNSFYQCPIGIAFTTQPDDVTSGLMIRRNLFIGTTQTEASVQSGFNETTFQNMLSDPTGLEWNWSDRVAPPAPSPGEINLFANNGRRGEAAFAFASTNPGDDQFLAPTVASQQTQAPAPRDQEKPWVGAVGP